jgi:hypothetical protein
LSDEDFKKRQNFKEKEKSCYKKSKNSFPDAEEGCFCLYLAA